MANSLSGHESIVPQIPGKTTVLDFWRWAFSDVKANNVRGVFAEWLVAILLDVPLSTRDSWAGYDLRTPDGVTIEVKASAYLQSWKQKGLSRISFGSLCGRVWMPDGTYAPRQTYNADVYVFCLQTETNPDRWNAFDLGQWRFFLLTKPQVQDAGCKSLSLQKLRSLSEQLDHKQLPVEFAALIRNPARTR